MGNTIAALVGNSVADGLTATISTPSGSVTIAALVGDATAAGASASVSSVPVNVTIAASIGAAIANGATSSITLAGATYSVHPSRLIGVTSPSRYVVVTQQG
jgi:hypothetical protein